MIAQVSRLSMRIKKRHTQQPAASGLLFTDLIPPSIDVDSDDLLDSHKCPQEIAPASLPTEERHPQQVERFIYRVTLTVARGPLRPIDVAITDAWSPLCKLRNDGRVYAALWELAHARGHQVTEHIWRIQAGYAVLSRISLCTVRALARAFERLEPLHYLLRYPRAHEGRVATTYWVRSPDGCRAMFADNRCTHVRILRGRAIELRARADGSDR